MKPRGRRDVILLKDLAPRKEVQGGAGKRVFGESAPRDLAAPAPVPAQRTPRKKKRPKS